VVSAVCFYILKLCVDINCWQQQQQQRSNLSASAAALFDAVLLAQYIPQAVVSREQEQDQSAPSPVPTVTSFDATKPTDDCDWSSQSSSAFSDCWSAMDSPDISHGCRKQCTPSDGFLSEIDSLSSVELSAFLDESGDWPFVQFHDDQSPTATYWQLPVTENFVPELKPHTPVSHGLLVDHDERWAGMSVRPVELVKPSAPENACLDTDVVAKTTDSQVPTKGKEVILSMLMPAESSICNVEENETSQRVVIGIYTADKLQAGGDGSSHSDPNDLVYDASDSEHTAERERMAYRKCEMTSFRCRVEPDFNTVMWPKDESTCRTRLEICRRELVNFDEYSWRVFKNCHGVHTDADENDAVEICQQLMDTASSETSSQLTAVPAGGSDDGGSSAADGLKKVDAKYETHDTDKSLSIPSRDTGRSHFVESLNEDRNFSCSLTDKEPQMSHMMKSAPSQSTGTHVFSNKIDGVEERICRRPEKCRRDLTGKYLHVYRISASCGNIASLNMASMSWMSGSQGNADGQSTENNLWWTERLCTCSDTGVSSEGWSMKDNLTSTTSFSTQAMMRDTALSHSVRRSYELLLPHEPDSLRDVRRHSHQNQLLKSLSNENVVRSCSLSCIRPTKSYTKLELLPSVQTIRSKAAVVQTVMAHQSLLMSGTFYVRTASEPCGLGVLPDCTSSHTCNGNLGLTLGSTGSLADTPVPSLDLSEVLADSVSVSQPTADELIGHDEADQQLMSSPTSDQVNVEL